MQSTRFHAATYFADSVDFPKFWASCNHGTVIAPKHSLYQKEATGMENPKCNPWFGPKSPLCRTGLQITQFHAAPYTAYSANFPKVGNSFNHGTVIAPMHSLYQKEAMGMENPKMYPVNRCKMPTSHYGSAKFKVLCSAVLGRQCRFPEIRGLV